MSTPIDLRVLYKQVLRNFDLGELGTELMARIMAGSERSDDYEEIIKHDHFLTKVVCTTASEHLKTSTIKSLGHGVVLVGQLAVRNMVLGHLVKRLFSKDADKDFQDFETETKKIKYALLAEEQAKKIKNEYSGIAFAAGYVFDIFQEKIATDAKISQLTPLLEDIWKHSLRAAAIAWALSSHERVIISHRKIIFAGTLLHDIGKLALACYGPTEYLICLEKMKAAAGAHRDDHVFETAIEKEYFDLTHPEVGSTLVFETHFLREMAMEVDFHHDITLLRMRNADAFLGGAVLNIADRLSWLSEQNMGFSADDVAPILKPHTSYFPLNSQDIVEVFAQIRAKRWV